VTIYIVKLKLPVMKTLGFIGGGRITRILLNGFKNAKVSFDKIQVYDTNEIVLTNLKSDYPEIEISGTDSAMAASSDWVLIALHPPVLMDSLQSLKGHIKKDALVVSFAPKIKLEKMQAVLPDVQNLARMNPNAGTYVNKGYNPVCFANSSNQNTVNAFIKVFEKLGKVPVVPENQIEAYAVVSAMGHTYFWFQLQELKELGMSFGLSEKEVQETISAMLLGTSETLFNSGLKYDKVTDLVPVKPLSEHENTIKEFYRTSLNGIYQKIIPV
jgi:pyrroline-5-carboxylate reductase